MIALRKNYSIFQIISHFFKGDLLCKKHSYKVFEQSFVASVCENNQPVMVKIHPLFYHLKKSPRMTCFRFSLCSHHQGEKVPPICDAAL